MKLLPIIFIHCPANRLGEYSNVSGRSLNPDLIPNSSMLFTRKCVTARGRIYNHILGVTWLGASKRESGRREFHNTQL